MTMCASCLNSVSLRPDAYVILFRNGTFRTVLEQFMFYVLEEGFPIMYGLVQRGNTNKYSS